MLKQHVHDSLHYSLKVGKSSANTAQQRSPPCAVSTAAQQPPWKQATPVHPCITEHNAAARQHTLHAREGQGGGQRQDQRHTSHADGLSVPGSCV